MNKPIGMILSRIPINLRNVKIIVFSLTFLTYLMFHATKKVFSVVKIGLHANCTEYAIHNHIPMPPFNPNFCWYPPFDKKDYTKKFSQMDLVFLIAYAIGMFVNGKLADTLDLKLVLSMGTLLVAISCGLLGVAYFASIHSFAFFLIINILHGIFQSSGWPATVALMANWFGKKKCGLIMGLWNSNPSIGNIVGSLIAGLFVLDHWGWSFMVPALILFFLGILNILFLSSHPKDLNLLDENVENLSIDEDSSEEDSITSPQRSVVLDVFLTPGVIEYSLSLFFIKLVSYSFLFCLPRFIHSKENFNAHDAANISTIFDIGGIAGGLILGLISDRIGKYALICVPSLILASPFIYIYYAFGGSDLFVISIMLFILGMLINGPYGLITTVVSIDLGSKNKFKKNTKVLATITAIIDGSGSIGAAIGPFIVGYLENISWKYSFMVLIFSICLSGIILSRKFLVDVKELHDRRMASNEVTTSLLQ